MPEYNASMLKEVIAEAIEALPYGEQTRLAEQLGVRVQTINKWRMRQTAPRPERWSDVEDALELERGTLARAAGIDATPPPPVPTASFLTGDEYGRIASLETLLREALERIDRLEQAMEARPHRPPDVVVGPGTFVTAKDVQDAIRVGTSSADRGVTMLLAIKPDGGVTVVDLEHVVSGDELSLAAEGDQDRADEVRKAPRRSRPRPE